MTTSPASSRRRGAQPGNKNAYKHGFYSSQFRPRELSDLQASEFSGLAEEIAVLRLFIRRTLAHAGSDSDLPETLHLLRSICLAATCLSRLVRTQHLLHDPNDELVQALKAASEELAKEYPALRPPFFTSAELSPPDDSF